MVATETRKLKENLYCSDLYYMRTLYYTLKDQTSQLESKPGREKASVMQN